MPSDTKVAFHLSGPDLVRSVSCLVERTSSQNWFWPEWRAHVSESLSSLALLGQSAGIRRAVADKSVLVRLGPFPLNSLEPVHLGQPRTGLTESDLRLLYSGNEHLKETQSASKLEETSKETSLE